MIRFENYEVAVVIVMTRFLEAIAIVLAIYLALKKYKLRYVIAPAGIVFLSVLTNLIGLIYREYFPVIASVNFLITALLLSLLVFYVVKNPEKTRDFTPPKETRCPVCNVLILREDELCTAKIGDYTYFFDTCHHLVQLLREPEYFLEKGSVFKGDIKEIFVKTKDTKRWKKLDNVKLVEENGKVVPYENPPQNAKVLDPKELLRGAQNVLGSR
ncbi:hypothetical protein JCM9492_15960 [Aquifex pyrophilus]